MSWCVGVPDLTLLFCLALSAGVQVLCLFFETTAVSVLSVLKF